MNCTFDTAHSRCASVGTKKTPAVCKKFPRCVQLKWNSEERLVMSHVLYAILLWKDKNDLLDHIGPSKSRVAAPQPWVTWNSSGAGWWCRTFFLPSLRFTDNICSHIFSILFPDFSHVDHIFSTNPTINDHKTLVESQFQTRSPSDQQCLVTSTIATTWAPTDLFLG